MALLIRRSIWRAGRKLYEWARKEERNETLTNGELRLQRLIIDGARSESKIIIFDVGARIGDWSKAFVDGASARSRDLELHVFEPVPDSRGLLEKALAGQVASGRVHINGIALSNESRTMRLYVPHFTGGTSTLHPDSSVKYQEVLDVQTSTIDRYCSENSIDRIDMVKIDTEGNDLRVIQGATELLRRGKLGIVQFEYNSRWVYSRSYLKDVFDLVRGTPYWIAKICSTSLEIYVEWHPELERFFETNYVLVHERLTVPLRCDFFRIGQDNVCERVNEAAAATSRAPSIRTT
jgi:FkbM family methyltransferase